MSDLTFKQLSRVCEDRTQAWDQGLRRGAEAEMLYRAVELGGEAGEVLNDVKKYSRSIQNQKGGKDYIELAERIKNELGDVVICAERLASFLNIDLEEAVRDKFNATSKKMKFPHRLL